MKRGKKSMKRISIAVVIILNMSIVSFAAEFNIANFGISLKGGAFTSDKYDENNAVEVLNAVFNGSEKVYTNDASFLNLGASLTYEQKIFDKQYIVFKIGYLAILDSTSYEVTKTASSNNNTYFDSYDVTYSAYSIPVGFCYKYKITRKLNIAADVGINIIHSDLSFRNRFYVHEAINGTSYDIKYDVIERSQTIITPEVSIGAEFLFSKYVGIFAEYGYWFSGTAEMKLVNSVPLHRKFEGAFFYVGINIYPFAFKNK
jgi:hypothetical protein